MLKEKTIILGVTGSIAAYKAANLASLLKKQQADVHVIMTKNAGEFITPVTFETLTGNKCLMDTFDRNFQFEVEHVELAKRADLVLVAPATANVIAKLAHGLADDMLTTTILACTCPKYIAPAMNTRMYENPVTQDNIKLLERYGWHVLEPAVGRLACGDTGAGKFPDESWILQWVQRELAMEKDMEGMKVLVTAGPTMEALDPVRFLSNHSTGKMGYAIAKICMLRGAKVTLVSGRTNLEPPVGVKLVPVTSAQEMFEAVSGVSREQDLVIKAAAVADYRPRVKAEEKIKKKDGELFLELERTVDILGWLGENKRPGQVLCGFAMETEHMLENARGKLLKKKADVIAANNVKVQGAGFGTDTNVVTLVTEKEEQELMLMSKEEVAVKLTDLLLEIYRVKNQQEEKE
ncbi:MAG TPA: bifunctional phosphopantothenoylcysteine decarboxylase/phosphopantothenate--cysteine ligase CoaBC [Candidatus Choladousia intestinavium]|uniref:Coenzyme A biosynthesis bifunctional protein CoaBC n=1 Tax=Candidatus Choladousia intestinavium TaxID=2840727 RepID=A0A9D1D8H7_9FIRM|nr:bifunctional phosphopantothenoylcysteine decarboxylase/phosphopantothenate--cysteine ligase CoaBC [Candidatus Choladousia intestinavium]